MQFTDDKGREGIVIEIRPGGCFARPADIQRLIDDSETCHPINTRFLNATWWALRSDDRLYGYWRDDPFNFERVAIPDPSLLKRIKAAGKTPGQEDPDGVTVENRRVTRN